MNKSELINDVAARTQLSKKDADSAVNAALTAIGEKLAVGEDVSLSGFGIFTVKARAAREGRNPRTGEAVQIDASKTVGFKPSRNLKASL